jgi:hypothetical protein
MKTPVLQPFIIMLVLAFSVPGVAQTETIEFKFSTAEQNEVNEAEAKASSIARVAIIEFETNFGRIDEWHLKIANAGTKIEYLNYVFSVLWSGAEAGDEDPLKLEKLESSSTPQKLLPHIPASGTAVLPSYLAYLHEMKAVLPLLDKKLKAMNAKEGRDR